MSKFSSLAEALSKKPGVYSPGGLAAYIGRRKIGSAEMARRAAARRRGGQ